MPINQRGNFALFALGSLAGRWSWFLGLQQRGSDSSLGAVAGLQQQPPLWQVSAVAQPQMRWPQAWGAAEISGTGKPMAQAVYANSVTALKMRRASARDGRFRLKDAMPPLYGQCSGAANEIRESPESRKPALQDWPRFYFFNSLASKSRCTRATSPM